MNDKIIIIKPGSPVMIGGKIEGNVTGVCIQFDRITYKVIWWNGNTREKEWLEEFEVECRSEKGKQSIGLRGKQREHRSQE